MSAVLVRLGVLQPGRPTPAASGEAGQGAADVLRGVGLCRSERVYFQACASGRVRVVREPALPDAATMGMRPIQRG